MFSTYILGTLLHDNWEIVGLCYHSVSLFHTDWESLLFRANYHGACYQTFFSEAMGVLGLPEQLSQLFTTVSTSPFYLSIERLASSQIFLTIFLSYDGAIGSNFYNFSSVASIHVKSRDLLN